MLVVNFAIIMIFLPGLVVSEYHRFQQPQHRRNLHCQCILPHLCNDDDVVENGYGIINPRISLGSCSNPREICCKNSKRPESQENDDHKPSPQEENSQYKPTLCGYAASNIGNSRVLGGTKAFFGELPWNLIIQETGGEKGKNLFKCGASLIHPKVAMTAAHCVIPYSRRPEKLLVRAGEWNVDTQDEPLPFQDGFVSEILTHHDYNNQSLINDIALLILSDSFDLADNIGFICLATPGERIAENECIVSGWGKNAHTGGKYSSTLKKLQVKIVSRDFCLHTLRSTRLGPRFRLDKSFICAGGKRNEDACKGDGGGPLMCPLLEDRDRFVQVGIVAWGLECGIEGVPGIYVNVPLYLEWIEREMDARDLDTSYFKII